MLGFAPIAGLPIAGHPQSAQVIVEATASASGVATVTGLSGAIAGVVGSSDGLSTVTGLVATVIPGVGSASGVATATGFANSVFATIASSEGLGTASGIAERVFNGIRAAVLPVFGSWEVMVKTETPTLRVSTELFTAPAPFKVSEAWTLKVKTYSPTLKVSPQVAALSSGSGFATAPLRVIASTSISPLRVRQRFTTA